ncbi:Fungal specific transcription factor domain-containing protein [Balamuthia mandrillaris]
MNTNEEREGSGTTAGVSGDALPSSCSLPTSPPHNASTTPLNAQQKEQHLQPSRGWRSFGSVVCVPSSSATPSPTSSSSASSPYLPTTTTATTHNPWLHPVKGEKEDSPISSSSPSSYPMLTAEEDYAAAAALSQHQGDPFARRHPHSHPLFPPHHQVDYSQAAGTSTMGDNHHHYHALHHPHSRHGGGEGEGRGEGSGGSGGEGSGGLNRKAVKRACSNCQKSHSACDNGRPCRRCITIGKTDSCRDAELKKRGRKPIKDPNSKLNSFAAEQSSSSRQTSPTGRASKSKASTSHKRRRTETTNASVEGGESSTFVAPSFKTEKEELLREFKELIKENNEEIMRENRKLKEEMSKMQGLLLQFIQAQQQNNNSSNNATNAYASDSYSSNKRSFRFPQEDAGPSMRSSSPSGHPPYPSFPSSSSSSPSSSFEDADFHHPHHHRHRHQNDEEETYRYTASISVRRKQSAGSGGEDNNVRARILYTSSHPCPSLRPPCLYMQLDAFTVPVSPSASRLPAQSMIPLLQQSGLQKPYAIMQPPSPTTGVILVANEPICKLFQYDQSELVGLTPKRLELLPIPVRYYFTELLAPLLQPHHDSVSMTVRVRTIWRTKLGDLFEATSAFQVFYDQTGNPLWSLCSFEDINFTLSDEILSEIRKQEKRLSHLIIESNCPVCRTERHSCTCKGAAISSSSASSDAVTTFQSINEEEDEIVQSDRFVVDTANGRSSSSPPPSSSSSASASDGQLLAGGSPPSNFLTAESFSPFPFGTGGSPLSGFSSSPPSFFTHLSSSCQPISFTSPYNNSPILSSSSQQATLPYSVTTATPSTTSASSSSTSSASPPSSPHFNSLFSFLPLSP